MLKVQVQYEDKAGRELRVLESVDPKTVEDTARRILEEYRQAAQNSDDKIVAKLILEEARKAASVLRAAGAKISEP
jgi:hypothetical protein